MSMYEKYMKHGKIRTVTRDGNTHNENYEFVDTCNGHCEECDKHTVEVDEYCIFGSEYDKCSDGINAVVVYDCMFDFLSEWYPETFEDLSPLEDARVHECLSDIQSNGWCAVGYDDSSYFYGNMKKINDEYIILDVDLITENGDHSTSICNEGATIENDYRHCGYTLRGMEYNRYLGTPVFIHYEAISVPFLWHKDGDEWVCVGMVSWTNVHKNFDKILTECATAL